MNKRNVGIGLLLAFGFMVAIDFMKRLDSMLPNMTGYHWLMTIVMVALFLIGIVLVLKSE